MADEYDRNEIEIDEINRTNRTIPESYNSFYIVEQPENSTARIGANANFYIVCYSDSDISYQWQYSDNNGLTYYNFVLQSATSSNLNLRVTEERTRYLIRCAVTSDGLTIYSSNVKLLTNESLYFSDCIKWLGQNLFIPLFNFRTPWGITFGALIVGIFGAPLLVKAYKKFF